MAPEHSPGERKKNRKLKLENTHAPPRLSSLFFSSLLVNAAFFVQTRTESGQITKINIRFTSLSTRATTTHKPAPTSVKVPLVCTMFTFWWEHRRSRCTNTSWFQREQTSLVQSLPTCFCSNQTEKELRSRYVLGHYWTLKTNILKIYIFSRNQREDRETLFMRVVLLLFHSS